MPKDAELLYVDGKSFDPDDLSYKEVREARRLVKAMWDEDADGEFDWAEVSEYEMYPALLTMFMRREDPTYTVEQALSLKTTELTDLPPTKPSPARSSGRSKASATSGSQS